MAIDKRNNSNDKKLSKTIELRYSALKCDDLIRILTKEPHGHTSEALKIARKELAARGMTNIGPPSKTDGKSTEKKEFKPAIKMTVRIFLYILWPIVWILFVGFINEMFVQFAGEILKGMVNSEVDQNTVSSNIRILNFIIEVLFFVVFWVGLIKTILIIKKKYSNKRKIFLYIIWPVAYIFSIGFIGITFKKLIGLIAFSMISSGVDPHTTNIRILAFIGGMVGAVLFCILYYILIKGFFVIANETKEKKLS